MKTTDELNRESMQKTKEIGTAKVEALRQVDEANKKVAERERTLAASENTRAEAIKVIERHQQRAKEEEEKNTELASRTQELQQQREREAKL